MTEIIQDDILQYIKEDSFQKIKLLSGKSIGIRKWVMREEKDFLFAIETQVENRDLLIEKALELSKKCVDDGKLFDGLSRNDLVYLISKQRALSKGEEISFSFHCNNEKCSDFKEFTFEQQRSTGMKGQGVTALEDIVNIKDDVKTKEFDFTPIEIGNFKFFMKEVAFSEQRKLEKKFIEDVEEAQLYNLNWDFVIKSVDKIELIKEEKTFDKIDEKTANTICETLSDPEFTKLSQETGKKMSSFNIEKTTQCPICESESPVVYDELFSLLVF